MKSKHLQFLLLLVSLSVMGQSKSSENFTNSDKIQILNFGTFHMGETPDAHSVDFDENNKKNQEDVHAIAKKLALFKPTVIIVETPPSYNDKLQAEYNNYILNPKMKFKEPNEIELLAYELGRIAGVKKIYGIDSKMEYNYLIGDEIENTVDSFWYKKYYKDPLSFYPEVNVDDKKLTLLEKLINTNQNQYLDFLIAVNADMLTHAGTEKGFEGADEAAKYYQRNLRMYTI